MKAPLSFGCHASGDAPPLHRPQPTAPEEPPSRRGSSHHSDTKCHRVHSGGNAWSPSAGDAEDAKEQQQHRHAESIDPRDLPRRVEVQEEEQEEETTPRRPSDVMSLAEAELRLEEGGGAKGTSGRDM